MIGIGSLADVRRQARQMLRPPPKLSLSEWADTYYYLSPESSAEQGRWKTLPYQKEILDSISDSRLKIIVVQKSARVGFTKCLVAAIGYFIQHAPAPILVVQPTVEDARGFSREEIAPMLRDVPVIKDIVFGEEEEKGPNDPGNTILAKTYPGGTLSLVGANSGTGFRRVSRKVILFDEVDAYPVLQGEGDVIKLGMKRGEYYWDRCVVAGSTPLVEGTSRIAQLFEEGDARRYFVPCPHCGHMDYFVFTEKETGGHWMRWDEGDPDGAHFVCSDCGCVIDHSAKRTMIEAGEWRATKQGAPGHRSYHVWAALSYSPGAQWSDIAKEFLAVKDKPDQLRTFVNTTLGETWVEKGEAPDWERLYQRREQYEVGTIPDGVQFLTCGVDVQKDRWVYEVVGWGLGKESWSIDADVITGNTANAADWAKLDELLDRTYQSANGLTHSVRMMAVDAGYNTQQVYGWARRYTGRVIATKGSSTSAKTLLGPPSPVEIRPNGKSIQGGASAKVWPVGTDIAKTELYGWLRLPSPDPSIPEETYPDGFCHFPQYGPEYFKQLTSEQLVTTTDKSGFSKRTWVLLGGRENHWLDARVYARAAATQLGLDRLRPRVPVAKTAPAPTTQPASSPKERKAPSGFLSKGGASLGRGKSWLKR